MNKNTNDKEEQSFMGKLIIDINNALKESALEARKIAKQTNTPLVVYGKKKGYTGNLYRGLRV